jgi:hypothetical protein
VSGLDDSRNRIATSKGHDMHKYFRLHLLKQAPNKSSFFKFSTGMEGTFFNKQNRKSTEVITSSTSATFSFFVPRHPQTSRSDLTRPDGRLELLHNLGPFKHNLVPNHLICFSVNYNSGLFLLRGLVPIDEENLQNQPRPLTKTIVIYRKAYQVIW